MDNNMFCFQCEQTAGCTGCTRSGVCGKTPVIANLQDRLTGAVIRLAENNEMSRANDALIIKSLFTTITNVNFNEETITKLIDEVHEASGNNADYDMNRVWHADEDIRSLKSLILFGIRGIAAYAYHAQVLGYENETVNAMKHYAQSAQIWGWMSCFRLPSRSVRLILYVWHFLMKPIPRPTEIPCRQRLHLPLKKVRLL